MTIEIYAKEECGICEAAKSKFKMMGLDYSSYDLQQTIEPHEGWREDGSIDVLAAYALTGNKVPIIRIDDDLHDYPGAMRKLKKLGLMGARKSGSESEAVH